MSFATFNFYADDINNLIKVVDEKADSTIIELGNQRFELYSFSSDEGCLIYDDILNSEDTNRLFETYLDMFPDKKVRLFVSDHFGTYYEEEYAVVDGKINLINKNKTYVGDPDEDEE